MSQFVGKSLDESSSTTSSVKTILDDFKPTGGNTSADTPNQYMWDTVIKVLKQFSDAMGKMVTAGTNMSESMVKAINLFDDYIDEDEVLDCSKLDELKQERTRLYRLLESTRVNLNKFEKDDPNFTKYNNLIASYTETINKLDALIKKIEDLKAKETQALAILNETLSQLKIISQEVNELQPGETVSYMSMPW